MFSRRTALPFVDLVMILLAFIVLLINPPTKQSQARPVADFALYVVWDMGRNTDVDVYVQGPDGKITWFRNKNIGYLSIDRDDLGAVNDSGPINQEIVGFRSPPDGSYLVSIHTYRESAAGPGQVALELEDREGRAYWQTTVPIPRDKEEVPLIELEFKNGAFVRSYPSQALIRYAARGPQGEHP